MSTVTLQLPPDTEQKLRDQASQAGQTLEAYLQRLAEKAVTNGTHTVPAPSISQDPVERESTAHGGKSEEHPRYITDPRPTKAEFEQLLGDLAAGPSLPVLPADFSRADIYDDHD